MQITLNQDDLNLAITSHVESLGVNLTNKQVEIDFTAGRGANGASATISFTSQNETTQETSVKSEEFDDSDQEDQPADNASVF